MLFEDLNLIEPILQALKSEGYTQPTPIQAQAIPHVLQGKDLLGCAQTGTGKTAAFSIPILQQLTSRPRPANARGIRTLILTPTRELAIQIDESMGAYGRNTGLKHAVIFGGVSQHSQVETLRRGVDILTATPGRLLDLMGQGIIQLSSIEIFVLDEADRMLDMGFIHDVRKVIAKLPPRRQTLFFSATMPTEIQKLADTILTNPVKVEVTPVSSTAEKIDQSVYLVEKLNKRHLLEHLLKDKAISRVLVFTRTKHGADRVVKELSRIGITAEAIHGNKSQNARQRALSNFKSGDLRVLIATDIAARGIDVDEITHVINYELPNEPETYVHRIGRTARAGASGIALSFCEEEERPYLKDIQKLIAQTIPVVSDHPFVSDVTVASSSEVRAAQKRPSNGQGQRRPSNQGQQTRSSSNGQGNTERSNSSNSGNEPRWRKSRT
ncbi:MAG: DEAD/DEAH box helicase [Bacteroidota bacterium]